MMHAKGIIQLCYYKIIDADSQKAWEKFVFEDTYTEFFMQAQFYNQDKKYTTFQEIVSNHPQAEKLHFLISTAAVGYIRQLNDIIPDIVNAHNKICLPFKNFRFEILNSHLTNKNEHKIAIWFYSQPLTWLDSLGNQLLIAYGNKTEAIEKGENIETDLITLQPFLSISSFQKT